MSSQSSAPLVDAAGVEALAAALVGVAERSFFAYAEATAPDHVVSTTGGWYEALVSFRGPFHGTVGLTLPVELARELCASFLGLEPDDIVEDAAVRDLAGEFANMACGTWLTGLEAASCFELTHPVVRAIDAAPAADVVVAVNERPVVIVLRTEAGGR